MNFPELRVGKRPAQTILYVTSARTFRVDTDRKGNIISDLETRDITCPTSNALPTCLDTILNSSQAIGQKVWIFYTQLNTYTLSLPSVQIQGVEDNILEHALHFELEALTGQATHKAKLAYQFIHELDEMSYYWLNVVASETLTRLLDICKKSRCKLGGLAHPGGLPKQLSEDPAPSWTRVECWPIVKIAMAKSPDAGYTMMVLDTDSNSQWQAELDQWTLDIGPVDKTETLMSGQIEYLADTDLVYRLNSNDQLITWLDQWAHQLANGTGEDLPLLRAESNVNKELLYMVGGGAAALLLCGAHLSWNLYQESYYQDEFERLTQTEKAVSTLRKSLHTDRDKVKELNSQLGVLSGNIDIIPIAMQAMQERPAELLYTLAQNTPENMVIEKISTVEDRLMISGVALEPQLANHLAKNSEADLNTVAWRVHPPTKKDMRYFQEGGPWSFDMQLEDLGLKGFVGQDQ